MTRFEKIAVNTSLLQAMPLTVANHIEVGRDWDGRPIIKSQVELRDDVDAELFNDLLLGRQTMWMPDRISTYVSDYQMTGIQKTMLLRLLAKLGKGLEVDKFIDDLELIVSYNQPDEE